MTKRLIPIADTHSLLKVGLAPPKFEDRHGVTHHHNKAQKYIWKLWQKVQKQALDTKDDIVVVLMGDLIHGDRSPEEVTSVSMKDQKDAVVQCILPYTNKAYKSYAIKGTKYHVGEDGIIEDGIAQELGTHKLKAFDKLEVEIEGFRFMFQHKGPSTGTRAWTKGNVMRAHLRSLAIDAMRQKREPCDYYLWAHFHQYLHECVIVRGPWGEKEIHGYVLPAWCAANEFALAVVKDLELSDIGMIYFDIGETVTCHKAFERFDNVERVTA